MFLYIIGIILFAILLQYPGILIIAGLIILAIYMYVKHPDSFAKLGIRIPTEYKSSEPKDNLSREDQDFETYKDKFDKIDAELEKKMKPGFRDDPEWQEMSAELRKNGVKNRKIADDELRREMLEEALQYAEAGLWNKVNAIEKELRDM